MTTTFQIIELNSLDPYGEDNRGEPRLAYPEALTAAREMKDQGKAFRVLYQGVLTDRERRMFVDLGALV